MDLCGQQHKPCGPVSIVNGRSPALDPATSQPVIDIDVAGLVEHKVESVQLGALIRSSSPRAAGVDPAHVQRLVEADRPLPPILVHRATMQVIDGFHRIAAAEQMGAAEIDAYLLDVPAESMFIVAVRANVTHGLPLSLADRRAAAERILCTRSDWSDRAIALATGLSAKTVSGIRCASGENQLSHNRLGRDGRRRPLDAAAGRRLAAELLSSSPSASLREIAAAAGVSPGTVRDVRARLSRGDCPVPSPTGEAGVNNPVGGRKPSRNSSRAIEPSDVTPVLQTLSKDPTLRMNAAGRDLLRWLHRHAVNSVDSDKIGQFVPDHCVEHLVELASRCAANWSAIAHELEHRAERQPPQSETEVLSHFVPNVERRTG